MSAMIPIEHAPKSEVIPSVRKGGGRSMLVLKIKFTDYLSVPAVPSTSRMMVVADIMVSPILHEYPSTVSSLCTHSGKKHVVWSVKNLFFSTHRQD